MSRGESQRLDGLLIRRLQAVGTWVALRPIWALITGLIVLAFLRTGAAAWNWFDLSPRLLTNWANPDSAFQSNVLFNGLGAASKAIGVDPSGGPWLLGQAVFSVAVLACISFILIRKYPGPLGLLLAATFLATSVTSVVFREIGRYDVFYILGICMCVLASNRWLMWFGAFVAATSSPEQLFVAGLLFLLVSLLHTFARWRPVAVSLLSSSMVVLVGIQLWFTLSGNPYNTRIGIYIPFLRGEPIAGATGYDTSQGIVKYTIEKLMVLGSAGPALLWSVFGVSLLLVLLIAISQQRLIPALYLIVIAVLAPPIIATLFGEDRTRDTVLISLPILLVVVLVGCQEVFKVLDREDGNITASVGLISIAISLIPVGYFYLYSEEPFRYLKELFIAINNGTLLPSDGSAR